MPALDARDILTPEWLQATKLLGVELTLDDGVVYPDEIYEQAIDFGLSLVEHEIDVRLEPFSVQSESHDYVAQDRQSYFPFSLDVRPVRSMTGMRLRYGNFAPTEFPLSWIRLISPQHGKINIMASNEALAGYLSRIQSPPMIGGNAYGTSFIPGYWEFDYEAGFLCWEEDLTLLEGEREVAYSFPDEFIPGDKYVVRVEVLTANGASGFRARSKSPRGFTLSARTAPVGGDASVRVVIDTIPADIKEAVAIAAAIPVLAVAGDLILGAGIASMSTSVDGLSQSINSTQSAMYSGYSGRIEVLKTLLDKALESAKSHYRMPGIFAV